MALGPSGEVLVNGKDKMVFAFHPQVSEAGGISRVSTHQRKPPPVKRERRGVILAASGKALAGEPQLKSAHRIVQVKNPEKFVHVIQKGDRLDKISMMYYGTHHRHREILKANPGLDPKRMRPGKKIVIPKIRGGLPGQSEVFIERDVPVVRDYVVKPGDVLGGISRKELGSTRYVSRILEVNPGLNPKKIKVGQVIRLPILDQEKNP